MYSHRVAYCSCWRSKTNTKRVKNGTGEKKPRESVNDIDVIHSKLEIHCCICCVASSAVFLSWQIKLQNLLRRPRFFSFSSTGIVFRVRNYISVIWFHSANAHNQTVCGWLCAVVVTPSPVAICFSPGGADDDKDIGNTFRVPALLRACHYISSFAPFVLHTVVLTFRVEYSLVGASQ